MLDTATRPDAEQAPPAVDGADRTDGAKEGKWQAAGLLPGFRRDLASTTWRLRRQILPHAITGGVACAGLAAHACAAGGGGAGIMSMLMAAGSFPAAWVWWKATKRRRPRWSNHVLGAGVVGASWLTLAPFGMGPEQGAALLAAEYAFASGWWRAKRITALMDDEVEVDEEEQHTGPTTLAEQIIADWDEFVACDGGPLPNARLSNPVTTKHTIAFDLEFWRGRQSLTTALAKLDNIAGGVDRDADEIIIEGLPKNLTAGGQRRSSARARFQIITDSPIAGDMDFTGPRRNGGMLDLGPFADGSGEAQWRLYTPGSMWSGVIIGGTGSGKSRLVENLVISALSGGDTIVIYVDPKQGGSSPALAEHTYYVPSALTPLLVDGLLTAIEDRGEENAAEGWTGFDPSPKRPGVLVVVEECHGPFANKHEAVRWARVAREGRSVGFGIAAISQYPGQVTFGNNEALRSSIMQGNGVVLHSKSNQTKGLMPGLTVDPKLLPDIPGYAYLLGNDEAGTRTAPWRNRNTGTDSKVTGAWIAAQPVPDMDPLLANAFARSGAASLFADRETAAQRRRETARARVEAMRNGLDPDAVVPRPRARETAVLTQTASSDENLGEVIEFPGPLTVEQLREEWQGTAAPLELSDSHRAVLAAVANGRKRPSEIEAAIGLKHRRVAELLKELVQAGHLIQPQYGRYETAA